ncbi:MAG TPA: NUDIX domain-containing protein [Candidatus Paceibacterota bacterium]
MFEMKPLEKPAQHWTVTIDGVRQPGIRHIELASQWGTLIWGQRPEGFEGWTFKEAGGAITIPWARLNGRILIGMIAEMRPNMGQRPSWCAIGGILDPGETHHQAVLRETMEESGIVTETAISLSGLPLISDRLYFVADSAKDEGVHAYHLPFSGEDLELAADGGWQLKDGLSLKGESVLRFFPWKEAARMTADSLLAAGILRLLSNVLED